MAVLSCDFYSEALEMSTSMSVVLPQETTLSGTALPEREPVAHPVLYLLHGLSDDHTMWLRRTSVERYAAPLGLAVVMPQAHRSFYTDEAHGNRYWTFLSQELPMVCERFFRISRRREDTFVAGLSMGGYGAVKWALREPERFAAAATLSGSLGLHDRVRRDGDERFDQRLRHTIFGGRPIDGTDDDVVWLLEQRAAKKDLPALYVGCGTEDALYEESVRFRDVAEAHGVPVTADFGPGDHTWDYWDAKIQDVLAWLPVRRPAVGLTDH